jgi:signal transduction histidine kinase
MAWTRSGPQRGALAAATALAEGQRRINNSATLLSKGETTRGHIIAIAAWLGVAGAAAPHVPPMAMMALLCATGAALLLFVALPSSESLEHSDNEEVGNRFRNERSTLQRKKPTCIQELLATAPNSITVTDRAAFAKLTAHMSHELRTPLNAILGFSELMSNEVFGPLGSSFYAGYARDIHASGLNLLKSAEDALAITALLTAPERTCRSATTNAAAAARDAIAFHAPAAAIRHLDISCTLDDQTEILCDPQTTRQLLINLIDDAASRAASGASITIASRNVGNEFEVLISVSGGMEAEATDDTFSMLLARTLAELCGARLNATTCDNDYHIATRFMRTAQHELFSALHPNQCMR